MRTIYAFEMLTLDGYYAGPNDEFDWPNTDEEFHDWSVRQLDNTDTLLFGRATYEGMAAYWPTAPADDPTAQRMNSYPKIAVSRTLEKVEWNNSRLIRDNVAEEITALKGQPGKDIAIFGSFDLTVSLLELGLIDELRILLNPIVLGRGKSLFNTTNKRIHFTLRDTNTFASGNVLLTYTPTAR
ncbi:MAG TPA: dihydrofolate reductase family protein [Mycobacteriales bacterium]|jgi:dihydrofolate reductase|nr:dihydrofolate reductase family protein [Mycobacteriales bacterium]